MKNLALDPSPMRFTALQILLNSGISFLYLFCAPVNARQVHCQQQVAIVIHDINVRTAKEQAGLPVVWEVSWPKELWPVQLPKRRLVSFTLLNRAAGDSRLEELLAKASSSIIQKCADQGVGVVTYYFNDGRGSGAYDAYAEMNNGEVVRLKCVSPAPGLQLKPDERFCT